MIEAYPLQYPTGWKRTKYPKYARFGEHSLAYARDRLIEELNRLGAKDVIISTNIPLRLDGLPRATYKTPEDKGVAVYFKLDGQDQCFPCDRWNKIEHNMWAIMKSIEALRGIERWGGGDMVKASFRGFSALPYYEPIITAPSYFDDCKTLEEVKIKYKHKLKYMHPDVGGSNEDFIELQRQYKESKQKFN